MIAKIIDNNTFQIYDDTQTIKVMQVDGTLASTAKLIYEGNLDTANVRLASIQSQIANLTAMQDNMQAIISAIQTAINSQN